MKGGYVLLVSLGKDRKIKIGKLGGINFKKGHYAYVGSAMNSLEGRIRRHLRKEKLRHWHIDYLLEFSKVEKVFYIESEEKIECKIAKKLLEKMGSIKNFGCSDCRCGSHLFYSKKIKVLENLLRKFGMKEWSASDF